MKKIFLLLLFISVNSFAQIFKSPAKPVQTDPFLNPTNAQNQTVNQQDKITIINTDTTEMHPDKYDGNMYFKGNVQLLHQGSTLFADEVIMYQENSFVKAIGNVRLQNADGSVITAEEMEYDGKLQRGIARRKVVLTDPKQTIKTDILYYDRLSNLAYFNTGGTITTETSTTYAKTGSYNTVNKVIDLTGNVKIDNAKYIVEGPNIKQNQVTNIAYFIGPTTIYDKNNFRNKVYTELGSFNQNTDEVFLEKNPKIYYNEKILTGKKLYFNRRTGYGTGKEDVLLEDPIEKRYIRGGYGEIYEKKDSAMITEKPYAVKILEKDTMYFGAEKFISFQRPDSVDITKKKSFLRAYHKGRFYKSNAQARADSISFDETDGILNLYGKPITWSGAKQVTGDKIEAYFNTVNENIDSLKVIGNAFAISKVDSLNLKDEFNQVKGRLMTVYYEDNKVKEAKVIGNAEAITYVDEVDEKTKKSERFGITLSRCGVIDAEFENQAMYIISCLLGSENNNYPMSMISEEKRKFPDFNWNTKDRLRKWEDVLVDSPNYEEIIYQKDTALFDQAQKIIDDEKAKEEAKKPKRERK